jgi:hypothetical protein
MNRDDARIARPCGADWNAMSPRGTARFCSACDKLVHDLSSMSEREARTLLQGRSTEGLCIRYLHDERGEIWFGGSAAGAGLVPATRLARRGAAMAAAAALVLTPVLTEACGGAAPDRNPYAYPFESADAGGSQGDRFSSDPNVAQDTGADGPLTSDAQSAADAVPIEASADAGESD